MLQHTEIEPGQSKSSERPLFCFPAHESDGGRESAIGEISDRHRERCFAMKQRIRIELALLAYLRTGLGWRRSLPERDRKRIEKEAKELAKTAGPDHPDYAVIKGSHAVSAIFKAQEEAQAKIMSKLATSLPVWETWAKDVRGFGAVSLAVIVGEAGDLSGYPKHDRLWKRLGVATIDGERQSAHPKGLSREDRRDYYGNRGYSPSRRSKLFVIGEVLVKQNKHYHKIYVDRKDYERREAEALGLTVAPAAKIPAKNKAKYMSHGHVANRAQRFMEKCFLRDLWKAWRRQAKAWFPGNGPVPAVPAAANFH
jgi:hypothetical protein